MSVGSDEKPQLPAYKATRKLLSTQKIIVYISFSIFVDLLFTFPVYQLQQEAPRPVAVLCDRIVEDCPPQYGREYHGPISRQDTDRLLGEEDGRYLIRRSQRADEAFTLAIR